MAMLAMSRVCLRFWDRSAWVAELADAPDLKSGAPQGAYGFDPRPGHLAATSYGRRGNALTWREEQKSYLPLFCLLFYRHLDLEGFGRLSEAFIHGMNIVWRRGGRGRGQEVLKDLWSVENGSEQDPGMAGSHCPAGFEWARVGFHSPNPAGECAKTTQPRLLRKVLLVALSEILDSHK
jgi:hypothetical protein